MCQKDRLLFYLILWFCDVTDEEIKFQNFKWFLQIIDQAVVNQDLSLKTMCIQIYLGVGASWVEYREITEREIP